MIFSQWMRKAMVVAGIWLGAGVAPALAENARVPTMDAATQARLAEVLAGDHRSAANKARDVYRHPAETLAFFGLQQDQTVVELWPGGGWYTEILAPVLKDTGTYYAAGFDPESRVDFFRQAAKRFEETFTSKPETYGTINTTVLAPGQTDIAPEGSADLVVSFRNLHNWIGMDNAAEYLAAVAKALKPGGYFGITDHRLPEDRDAEKGIAGGYVAETAAIALIEEAGLRLVDTSEVNANPKDTADYEKGVWTLPPRLTLGETDRAKYIAIGESDRFTLLFQKPVD